MVCGDDGRLGHEFGRIRDEEDTSQDDRSGGVGNKKDTCQVDMGAGGDNMPWGYHGDKTTCPEPTDDNAIYWQLCVPASGWMSGGRYGDLGEGDG